MITDRIDNIIRIPEDYRCVKPPVPKSVKIELTSRCNYRCGFCSLRARTDKPQDMDFKFFKNITRQLKDLGVKEIGLFLLGESLTNPLLLIRAIKWCHDIDFDYIFLTSNASLASPQLVVDCMAAGLDSLKWSVNFSSYKQFKEIAGVKENLYLKALNNIISAKEVRDAYGYETKLYASSIRYDDKQNIGMQRLLDNWVIPYVDQHYWLPLYKMGSAAKEAGLKPVAGNTGRFDNPVPPVPCWSLFTEGHIMADGRLTACGFDATGDWAMGDLKEVSFMDAWHWEEFQQLRQEHLNGNVTGTLCENCNG